MGMQTKPTFLPNKGPIGNAPKELLKDVYSSYSRNMEIVDERIQGRLGISKFDTTALSGPVLLEDQFWENDSSWHLMICTTKDVYKYDFTNSRFDILTPLYTTGKITISAGSLTIVQGSGTSWSSELKAGDYIKIGTGNVHSAATWYEVDSVDSNTQLTLTSAAAACSASGYTARQTFSGTDANQWDCDRMEDINLGAVWLATNGVDAPIRYTGTGQVQAIANLPTGFTTCRYIKAYDSRCWFIWCVVDAENKTKGVYWSATGNCESYTDTDYVEFRADDIDITGAAVFNDYLVIFRQSDAQIGRYVGGAYTYLFTKESSCPGAVGSRGIVVRPDAMYFYCGNDKKFYAWNLLRAEELKGDEMLDFTKDFNPNLEHMICGMKIPGKNQIRWFVPHSDTDYLNYCMTYDLKLGVMQVWEYESAQALMSIGSFINTSNLYTDDTVWGEYYVDEQEGYWDDVSFIDNAEITIYGGYDGYIRYADNGVDDDGSDYDRTFRSTRMNFDDPLRVKRLHKQQYWLESQVSGTLTIKLRRDDSVNFDTTEKSIDLAETDRDIIKKNITWDKYAQNFEIELTAQCHWALIGFISMYSGKNRTV